MNSWTKRRDGERKGEFEREEMEEEVNKEEKKKMEGKFTQGKLDQVLLPRLSTIHKRSRISPILDRYP